MKSLSKNKIPAKYRYLKKQIEEIAAFIENLPRPDRDFSSLKPYERDLVEFLNGAISLAAREQHNQEKADGYTNTVIKIDTNLIDRFAAQYLKKEEIEKAKILFKNCPETLMPKSIKPWDRKPKNNLLAFLNNQQKRNDWLPQGYLNYKNLRWVAWDELLNLVINRGYDNDNDDIRNIDNFDHWETAEKTKLIHLFLEMINNEKVTRSFNARIDDPKKKHVVRERFYYYTR